MPMQPPAPQGDAGAPAPAPEQGAGGGGASQLVAGIASQLSQLLALMQKAKLPPEDIQMLQQLMAGYEQFVQALQGGGEEEPQGPQGSQGSTPMETGGKPSQPAL